MFGRIIASVACAAALGGAAIAQQPPVSAYARLPAIESPVLSPDGTRIAHLEHNDNGDFLVIRNAEDFAPVTVVGTANVKARAVLWADDDIVVMIASDAASVFGVRGQVEFAYPFSVNLADDNTTLQLMQRRRAARTGSRIGVQVSQSYFNPNKARIVGREPSTGRLLIPDLDGDTFDLFAVDPATDERDTIGRGTTTTRDWVVDQTGSPIARIDYRELSDRFAVRVRHGDDWDAVVEETVSIPGMAVYGVDAGGDLIIGARLDDTGRYGLHALSLSSGEIERPFYVNDEYDVGSVIQDPYTNLIIGASVQTEAPTTVWFDDELAARQTEVEQALGGIAAMITSWSADHNRFLVRLETGANPTLFFLYDVAASSLKPITSTYPEALAAGVAVRQSIRYPARDGVGIPAYMTMADDLPTPAPLVVLPHGGPEARDVGGFDWIAHFFASRGYIVLQPEFRGSDGYGAGWRDAGRGEWGTGVMQNDITDGVQVFIEEGLADPDRVCIVGASYGGYAALAGAVFTPDLYACAAAISPVADVGAMIDYERDRTGRGSPTVEYWRTVIGGDPDSVRGQLNEISPQRHAADALAPILLIHGRDDSVVPISQSRNMARALRRADKEVELIELDGEDHWLSRADTRQEMLEALDGFLAEHLAQ